MGKHIFIKLKKIMWEPFGNPPSVQNPLPGYFFQESSLIA